MEKQKSCSEVIVSVSVNFKLKVTEKHLYWGKLTLNAVLEKEVYVKYYVFKLQYSWEENSSWCEA